MERKQNEGLWLAAMAVSALICFVSVFIAFFPNRFGRLGHDYATFLPTLLDGFVWIKVNGLGSVPWFTPSFFGGSLGYANPQSGFYTLPQMLTCFVDPLTTVQASLILFAGIGFAGFFRLLHRGFGLGGPASLAGGVLFLFNGFYAHRMAVGHFGAHPFMLMPWVMLVMLRPLPQAQPRRTAALVTDCVLGGLFLAYMVQTWYSILILPTLAAILSVAFLHALGGHAMKPFWFRFLGGGGAGLMLCASKLSATVSLMANFDRSGYALPGAGSFAEAVGLLARSLFASPAFDADREASLTHLQWHLARHEWEFSLTPVPLVILLAGLIPLIRADGRRRVRAHWARRSWPLAAALVLMVLLPAAVNTYAEAWNHLLKQIPVIRSASNLVRWFIIPMPGIVVGAAMVLDRSTLFAGKRLAAAALTVVAVVAINAATDREFYHRQTYSPWRIVLDYHRVRTGERKPAITGIGVYTDGEGRIRPAPIDQGPNDMMVDGLSPLLAYDPLFGYRQEWFPVRTLHSGPVMSAVGGVFNLKNPACYLWPEANRCRPGDHFRLAQKADAEAFARYRPFGYRVPARQRTADAVNLAAMALAGLWLSIRVVCRLWGLCRRASGAGLAVDSPQRRW